MTCRVDESSAYGMKYRYRDDNTTTEVATQTFTNNIGRDSNDVIIESETKVVEIVSKDLTLPPAMKNRTHMQVI